MCEPVTYRAVLIGGPCDQRTVTLTAIPPLIEAAGVRYSRLDDPDTGAYLGGYAVVTTARYEPSAETPTVEVPNAHD